jgi:hypothetical protein
MSASSKLDRRSLLKGSTRLGVALSVATSLRAGVNEAKAYDPGQDERRARYREGAEDVQAFYRTNGYETLKKK